MKTPQEIEETFIRHGGVLNMGALRQAGIHYYLLQSVIRKGMVEKVKRGWYQWVADSGPSEAATLKRLFPDAVFCMHTALFHYGYTDRVPQEWHLAVPSHINRKRFSLPAPLVKPHYFLPQIRDLGTREEEIDGVRVPMHDRDRVICDCLRFRNQMDREIFNKAIQAYLAGEKKDIANLLRYADILRCRRHVSTFIEPWLT